MPNQSEDATIQVLEIVGGNTLLLESVRDDIGFLREAVDRQAPEQKYALTMKETLDCVKTIEAHLASEAASRENEREQAAAAALASAQENQFVKEPTVQPGPSTDLLWFGLACGLYMLGGMFVTLLACWSLTWLGPKGSVLADGMAALTLGASPWQAGHGLMERAKPDPKAPAVAKGQSLHIDADAMAKCRETVLKSGGSLICKVRITLDPVESEEGHSKEKS